MRLLALLAFAAWSLAGWAEVLEGRVVSIADGDTITLLDGSRQQHRIHCCPAPIDRTAAHRNEPGVVGLEGYEEMQTVSGIVFLRQGWWCRMR